MIKADSLTKRYGPTLAVDGLSFEVPRGTITGFLGPNGSGKSTTMRMILGLDRPTSGAVTLDGKPYAQLSNPTHTVGALLNPEAVHPGRTARAHLTWIARATATASARVEDVLEMVGIAHAADRRISTFSLGMRQRLGIGVALLNDPETLILDEPLNGLDPDGIIWLRGLLRQRAARGGTVLISSHLMNEMQATADHVIVIARGKLVAHESLDDLTSRFNGATRVVSSDPQRLSRALTDAGATVAEADGKAVTVHGIESAEIGRLAMDLRIVLTELVPEKNGLEAVFIKMTHESGVAA